MLGGSFMKHSLTADEKIIRKKNLRDLSKKMFSMYDKAYRILASEENYDFDERRFSDS